MPQNSVAYAVGRVHVVERDALDEGRIDRLLAAASYAEAMRTLSEIGFGAADGEDIELVAAKHVEKACALVRRITPDENATDCFLLRYDALNLKALLKARSLGQHAALLSACGVYPIALLETCVKERDYRKLPAILEEALKGLEMKLALGDDALAIDVTVDRAIYALIQEKLTKVDNRNVRWYFAARADMLGAIMLLRAQRMGRDRAFFEEMLLPGGTISLESWQAAYEKPEAVIKLLAPYGKRVQAAAALAIADGGKLPALEKAMDDALLRPFSQLKRSALRLEPVIGHLLGAEREAAAVRLILAGKANGFSATAIRERLRDLYGS